MDVSLLSPSPTVRTEFAWSHSKFVPAESGCYAITTHAGDVLYVGLASKNIRARMEAHLNTAEKRRGSVAGVPFWFHYRLVPSNQVKPVERGWMNQSILTDGDIPPLNKVYSPT